MSKPYTITTAISYPNGRPHIGHAYEAILADSLARFHRQQGRDVYFQTGTDEHGLKMAQAARDRGIEPKALADEMSGYFKEMNERLNISYDRFIRTSEPDHHRASQAIWQAMEANGDLYLGRYEGWYSVRDEAFYDEKEITDGEGGIKLSPQGTPVEWTVEESWFFRLSKYQEKLLALYESQPDFIQPDSRRNEILRFVEGGLSDLSVSRTSFDWGVKVPGSDGHVMYVWVDALTNYLTGCGYPDDAERMDRYWAEGGDITHIIGKDIVRFHTVYWPAFLMSAKLPLPKNVFGHGFLLNRGEKMSKSVGNVTNPLELADHFGVDQLRYFLLSEVPYGKDGSYSVDAIVERCNSDLANGIGNSTQRVLSLIHKHFDGRLYGEELEPTIDLQSINDRTHFLHKDIPNDVRRIVDQLSFDVQMGDLDLRGAVDSIRYAINRLSAYITIIEPWKMIKHDRFRAFHHLRACHEAISEICKNLYPFMPASVEKMWYILGNREEALYPGFKFSAPYTNPEHAGLLPPLEIVFPRLEPTEADA